MTTNLKHIFRWIAVVPGALVSALLVLFPVHWVALFIHHFGGWNAIIADKEGRGLLQSIPLESLERFGDALLVTGTFIAVGALIAPRFHFTTAIVLTLLLVGVLSWGILKAHSMGMLDDSPSRMVITAILWFVSIVSALSYARGLDKA